MRKLFKSWLLAAVLLLGCGVAEALFVPSAIIAMPVTATASQTVNSAVVNTQGFTRYSIGLTTSHAGTLSVQRYVDAAGAIPLSTPATVALVAATPNSVGFYDGLPSGSIVVSFVNSAGGSATLTGATVLITP